MPIYRTIYFHQHKVCIRKFLIGFLSFLVLVSCQSDKKQTSTLTVFAAASLSDVLSEIADSFEQDYPTKVKFNRASSGTLARQIEQGATPDLYISASPKWMEYLSQKALIKEKSPTIIAKNELVLIAPSNSSLEITADSLFSLPTLLDSNRLSIGDPTHVPAGQYAKESLVYYNWFDSIRLLPAKDVRSALMVVEMQEAPLGIVYRTDAQKSEKVKIVHLFSENSHQPIVYMAGICQDSLLSNHFLQYLNSAKMIPVWKKYGFKK